MSGFKNGAKVGQKRMTHKGFQLALKTRLEKGS